MNPLARVENQRETQGARWCELIHAALPSGPATIFAITVCASGPIHQMTDGTGQVSAGRMLTTVTDLHPDVAVLAPLLGIWQGRGAGEYPTIEPFGYLEEISFGHVGKPFLAYGQRTKAAGDGRPLHAETGYLRVPAPGRVEWVLAHPTGITEVLEGALSGDGKALSLELTATTIGRTASAKEVAALARSFRVDGDELTYTVRMGAVGQPLQHHLSAALHRAQS